ncbi:nucleocapsid protein [Wencheng Sm shrew coronavirus]|uniref:nucleocapsid protein n=1 Tax=Wencheng Sm shrew coronavirus TaxID=1508228 RepID=UPI000B5B777C|nr:nucleocapsid protein [Wencheng Sm shrew coronavirus]ASF90453.1 nucleocapsid protein [Wencheng Sm shrew coronavirus]
MSAEKVSWSSSLPTKADTKNGSKVEVELSAWDPIIIQNNKNIQDVLPRTSVPKGLPSGHEIGYWYKGPERYRFTRGEKVPLDPKWYFYPLGHGPAANKKWNSKVEGVFWVARDGASIEKVPDFEPRKKGAEAKRVRLPGKAPANVYFTTTSASRSQSRDNSRAASRSGSKSRIQSRSPSAERGHVDIKLAVLEALKDLGIGQDTKKKSSKSAAASGNNTPKQESSPKVQRKQIERLRHKRVPTGKENITVCFGPRGPEQNFGSDEIVNGGAQGKKVAQLLENVPGPSALLFGGKVEQIGKANGKVAVQYTYVAELDDNEEVKRFLDLIDAYKKPTTANSINSVLNPQATAFAPPSGVIEELQDDLN